MHRPSLQRAGLLIMAGTWCLAAETPQLVVSPDYLELAISRQVTDHGWGPRTAFLHAGLTAQVTGCTMAYLTYDLLEAVDNEGRDLIDDYTKQTVKAYSGESLLRLGPPTDLAPTAPADSPSIMFALHPTDADTSIARLRLRITTHLTDGTRTTLRVGPWPTGLDRRYAVPGEPRFSRLSEGGVRLTYAASAHQLYKNFWYEVDGTPHQGYNGHGGTSNENPNLAQYDLTGEIPDGAQLCLDLITLTGSATAEVTTGPWGLADRGPLTAFPPVRVPLQVIPDAP